MPIGRLDVILALVYFRLTLMSCGVCVQAHVCAHVHVVWALIHVCMCVSGGQRSPQVLFFGSPPFL